MIPAILMESAQDEIERRKRNRLFGYFPDRGSFRRDLYSKHVEFFAAGKVHRERAFIAGNRVGKTVAGAYEAALHLTGLYPDWWPGRRFAKPTSGWAAGDTSKTVKDILQVALLGEPGSLGTGMIPAHLIGKTTARAGLADAVDTVQVKHASGGHSTLGFKSFDQRREAYQGTAKDFIWLDEECPLDIYAECLIRTMTTDGLVMLTFTPLMGLTEVVLTFLPGGSYDAVDRPKHVTMCTWDDVPHLGETAKRDLLASIPPYQRDARMMGIPQLGSGAIYPISESDVVVDDFDIPPHWPRAYGMDVGWNRTAVAWGALNRETDTVYLYSEHYRGEGEPPVHVEAIKGRGAWIKGVIDPAARGRGQGDGLQLMQRYRDLGLDLEAADNGVESGIFAVWNRLVMGKLKVFKSLGSWREEFRLYRRDDKGKVVKERDHLQDSVRYLIVSGLDRAKVKDPVNVKNTFGYLPEAAEGWMG